VCACERERERADSVIQNGLIQIYIKQQLQTLKCLFFSIRCKKKDLSTSEAKPAGQSIHHKHVEGVLAVADLAVVRRMQSHGQIKHTVPAFPPEPH
jgi:hypothetical protein